MPTDRADDPSTEKLDDGYIHIPEPDEPVYRMFPLWFLEDALRTRQLVLVRPGVWDDPFEQLERTIMVMRRRGESYEQVSIGEALPPVFAQCWSATRESDTLLRAYSRVVRDPHMSRNLCPRDEGVRVKSTPRKLLEALRAGTSSGPPGNCYVGAVKYMEQKALLQEVANAVGARGDGVFTVPENRAKLLLLKREAFSHESEVRLLYVQRKREQNREIVRVPFDPANVFDEITFDPRLAIFERKEREAMIRNLGFAGAINEWQLYEFMPILNIRIEEQDE